jgi:hypothetical protein
MKTSNQKLIYILLALSALFACAYSYSKTSINSPTFPSLFTSKLKASMNNRLISSKSFDLDKDTSDRKLSKVTRYDFRDGSHLFAVMVRVRKRDDFKIETYGLLTKGIDLLHIKSPLFNNKVPYSMMGLIKGLNSIQTCIIPGTSTLDQVNVQLFPLLSEADRLTGSNQSISSKILGIDDRSDYSCLVLTFQPKSIEGAQNEWQSIIRAAQISMISPGSDL